MLTLVSRRTEKLDSMTTADMLALGKEFTSQTVDKLQHAGDLWLLNADDASTLMDAVKESFRIQDQHVRNTPDMVTELRLVPMSCDALAAPSLRACLQKRTFPYITLRHTKESVLKTVHIHVHALQVHHRLFVCSTAQPGRMIRSPSQKTTVVNVTPGSERMAASGLKVCGMEGRAALLPPPPCLYGEVHLVRVLRVCGPEVPNQSMIYGEHPPARATHTHPLTHVQTHNHHLIFLQVTHVVSQTDVVRVLYDNKAAFGAALGQTVEALEMDDGAVLTGEALRAIGSGLLTTRSITRNIQGGRSIIRL